MAVHTRSRSPAPVSPLATPTISLLDDWSPERSPFITKQPCSTTVSTAKIVSTHWVQHRERTTRKRSSHTDHFLPSPVSKTRRQIITNGSLTNMTSLQDISEILPQSPSQQRSSYSFPKSSTPSQHPRGSPQGQGSSGPTRTSRGLLQRVAAEVEVNNSLLDFAHLLMVAVDVNRDGSPETSSQPYFHSVGSLPEATRVPWEESLYSLYPASPNSLACEETQYCMDANSQGDFPSSLHPINLDIDSTNMSLHQPRRPSHPRKRKNSAQSTLSLDSDASDFMKNTALCPRGVTGKPVSHYALCKKLKRIGKHIHNMGSRRIQLETLAVL